MNTVTMARLSRLALVATLAALASVGAASADWFLESDLIGELGTIHVEALVTDDGGGWYTYLYDVTATDVVAPIHTVSVGNPEQVGFENAQNSGASVAFTDPFYQEFMTSVIWINGVLLPGETGRFSYESRFVPQEVDMSVLNAGHGADGVTLGMSAIPEPTAVPLVAGAALGWLGWFRFRGRR